MQYFSRFPDILTKDNNNNIIILKNLMARSSIITSLLTDPLLFYTYDLQDGDTPEIVAHKYYDDVYRYWIVLYANQIMDPQWDWPMDGTILDNFVTQKYGNEAYGLHHYEKITEQTESVTGLTTKIVSVIDETTYDALDASSTTYTLPSGSVTVNVSKRSVTNYVYELEKNESKRTIKLLNKTYVPQLEAQFKKLMAV